MTYTLDLDQQHFEAQDAIALDFFTDGEAHAFDGIRPMHSNYEYLMGYRQGLQRFSDHLQHQSFLLQQEGIELEEAVAEF